jgi:hypothetical protein
VRAALRVRRRRRRAGELLAGRRAAVAQKRAQDEQQVADLVNRGVQPVRLVYHDGGGHEAFRQAIASATVVQDGSLVVEARSNRLGAISRPEALAAGPQEIVLDPSGRPKDTVAYASANATASVASPQPTPQAPTAAASAKSGQRLPQADSPLAMTPRPTSTKVQDRRAQAGAGASVTN